MVVSTLSLKALAFLAVCLPLLNNRHQRVVLNGKSSVWSPITAGLPQGSVLGPLLFLIYINDSVDNISSEAKLFADDISLFTVVYDVDIVADQLNRDLEVISNWAHQWNMQFNPDKNKQAVQVIFSQKKRSSCSSTRVFNGSKDVVKAEHKHLGMIPDSKLSFQSHVREAVSVNSKPDHPPGQLGFAHSSCPWGRVSAPLSCPGFARGSAPGVLNQSKSSIILKKKRDFCFVY